MLQKRNTAILFYGLRISKIDLIKYFKDDTKDQCYEVIYFTVMILNYDDKWHNLPICLFPSMTSLKVDFSLES